MHNTGTDTPTDEPVRVWNAAGRGGVVLICEHASNHIPVHYARLGLPSQALQTHIAWDPGALDVARHMAQHLEAPLVHGTVSRLVYDCNRPPEAPGAMTVRSEMTDIPGNRNLTEADRQARVTQIYDPFHRCVAAVLKDAPAAPVLVTIHSFTPVYAGQRRLVEIGLLHDTDSRLADAMLAIPQQRQVARNAPYGPQDGVTHTLQRHALPRGMLNVMIEIRNDLITNADSCAAMAKDLAHWITGALDGLAPAPGRAVPR